MSDIAVSSPITDAYLTALRDAIGRPIGDAVIPDGWDKGGKPPAAFYPYGVLYVGTTLMQGTLVEPKEDGLHRVQLSAVGRTRAGASALRDAGLAVLLDMTLTADGFSCVMTELVSSLPVSRNDAVSPALFDAVCVVHALWTPASGS